MRSWLKRLTRRPGDPPGPEQDVAIAERALAAGELAHAAFHLGCALVHDPLHPEWLTLLERLAALEADPIALTPVSNDGGLYFATAAVRGWLLERLGKIDEALPLLFMAVSANPDAGALLEWAIGWLEARAGAADLDLEPVGIFLAGLPETLPDAVQTRLPRLIRAAVATGGRSPMFVMVAARTLRERGDVDGALALAEAGYAAEPQFATAVAVGANRRESGDMDGALAAFLAALELQPDDIGVLLDLGDLLWDDGRLDDALARYDAVLAQEPDHAWALPSRLGVRREQGDPEAGGRLAALAMGGNARAQALERALPWIDLLPAPREASVGVGVQALEQGAVDVERLTLSALEAPSALRALERELARRGAQSPPEITVEKIGRPDPRLPRQPVRWPLWRYDGVRATSDLPPPDPALAAQVAALARTRYRLDPWAARARHLGRRLGPAAAPELLACLVHPPDPPDAMPWWEWLYRLHFAVALTVAQTEASWPGSARRDALLSLVDGPLDWSNEAGAIALLAAAQKEPQIWGDATAAFRRMLQSPPRPGFVGYILPAAIAWLHAPDLDRRTRTQLETLLRDADG